jgi:hypothetical protein
MNGPITEPGFYRITAWERVDDSVAQAEIAAGQGRDLILIREPGTPRSAPGPAGRRRRTTMAEAVVTDCSNVTRFEVIDHSAGAVNYRPDVPRSVVAYGVTVQLSLQDDGRTLKVFLRCAATRHRDRPGDDGGKQ